MNKEQLHQRKSAIEQRFEQLAKQRQDLDDELKRLQGEHRLVIDLIEDDKPKEDVKPKRLRKIEEEPTDAKN